MSFAFVSGTVATADFLAERATAVSFGCWDGLPIRGGPATGNSRSVQRDDHLVRANQPELRPCKLVGEVRVGVARIEKLRAVLELGLLLLQLRKLGLPLLKGTMIAAPGEDPVRPCDRMSGESPDDDQGQRRHCRAANETETPGPTPHDIMTESRASRTCK